MISRLFRILFAIEFLVALPAVFTLWSQVGGQYHLDLMFWPWKLGIGIGAAALFTALTGEFLRSGGRWTRRALMFMGLLLAMIIAAGSLTYYYHLTEPNDDTDSEDTPVTVTRL